MEVTQPRNVMYPPTRIPFGTYTELEAGKSSDIFELTSYSGRIVHLDTVTIQSLSDVFVETEYVDESGLGTSEFRADTMGGISSPEILDLLSTDRMKVVVSNRSSTTYTDADAGAIRLWGSFTVEEPTVVEKMIHRIPLGSEDESLMKQFDLDKKDRYGMLSAKPIEKEASVEDKEIIKEDYVTGEDIADDKLIMNENAGGDVLILNGISVDGATGTLSDGVELEIIQDGDTLTTIDNYGMPSIDTEVKCFVPAMNSIKVRLTGSGSNSVKYKFHYTKVPLTLVEKAMWLPIEEISPSKRDAYKIVRNQLEAGVDVGVEFESVPKG